MAFDSARVFPLFSLRPRRGRADQEDHGLSPVPRGAGGGAGDLDRLGDGGFFQGEGGSGDLWQGSGAGIEEGGRLLAHAGQRQEHLDVLLRREAAATAGDEQPDAGGGDGSQ